MQICILSEDMCNFNYQKHISLTENDFARFPLLHFPNGRPFIPVTVIIPCYNCTNTIRRSVESVFFQTSLPSQIILVDDGNNEEFYKIVSQLRTRSPVQDFILLRNSRNLGPSRSRNRAWDAALQPFIAFLDADDSWHPIKLEQQYALFASNPELTLAAHASRCIKNSFQPGIIAISSIAKPISAWKLLLTNYFSTPTVMLRRDIPFRFNNQVKYAEDYDLWLRIILSGLKGAYLPTEMTYLYKDRFGEGGLSSRLFPMERGVQKAYSRLSRTGLISPHLCNFLRCYSALKFTKRIIQTWITLIRRHVSRLLAHSQETK